MRNRFKGLDLIDRVPDELWNEVRDIGNSFLDRNRKEYLKKKSSWKLYVPDSKRATDQQLVKLVCTYIQAH